jgi:SNF2 family DNA or RNA helicase
MIKITLYANTSIRFTPTNRIECENATNLYISIANVKDKVYNIVNQELKECGTIPYDNLTPQEFMIITEVNDKSDMWDYELIFDNSKKYVKQINYNVDINKFLKNIKKLRNIEIDFIIYGIMKNFKKLNTSYYINDSWKKSNIKHINNDSIQPYLGDIKLYTYQLRTLQWLKNVEENICTNGIDYTSVVSLNELYNTEKLENYYFDYINHEILHVKDISKKVHLKGGILADEMGLGKTITMISLTIDKPRHINYLTYDKNTKETKINIDFTPNTKIITKANLIVCPSHLAKQWQNEALRCNPKMRIVMLLTKPNHESITYKDILEAELVITTFQFLTNVQHYPSIGFQKVTPTQLTSLFNERLIELDRMVDLFVGQISLGNPHNILEKIQPILEHFEWHRLIVDEAHELFGLASWSKSHQDQFLSLLLQEFHAEYKWYISGTPFTSEHGFRSVMEFLGLKSNYKYKFTIKNNTREIVKSLNFKQLIERGMNEKTLYEDIMKQLFCRNTKDSIGNEWDIPAVLEETIKLDLTNIERGMYEQGKYYGSIYLRQICCHPNISNQDIQALGVEELSLEDVRLKLIEHKKNLIVENEGKIQALDHNKDNEHNYEYRKKQLMNKTKELEYEIKFFTSINPVVPNLPEDSCPICMGDFDNIVVTDCGHYFCKECIMNALNVTKKMCPMCRAPLTMKDIYTMKKTETGQIDYLTFKYGSKMGKLISMCKQIFNDPTARIIIFSQWERLLLSIGRILKENLINNVYCKGNVHQRNATIKAFKDGIRDGEETKVIMLSLEHSASGTNLTEATHIIIMDPVDGTKEEIKAIEGQAIGRAARMGQKKQVKIIRLITKNTIEEEIYTKSL